MRVPRCTASSNSTHGERSDAAAVFRCAYSGTRLTNTATLATGPVSAVPASRRRTDFPITRGVRLVRYEPQLIRLTVVAPVFASGYCVDLRFAHIELSAAAVITYRQAHTQRKRAAG